MNVKEIVIEWLMANGYDGLFEDRDGGCACELEKFMPCNRENIYRCQAGYRTPCDCGDHDFHIGIKLEAPK